MKWIILSLFFIVNMWDYKDIKPHVKNAQDLASLLNNYNYIPDKTEADEWVSPYIFFEKGGGDCEDFSLVVFYILKDLGYDVTIYVVKDYNSAHAICWYKKENEEGYFSDASWYHPTNWTINDYCREYMWDSWEIVKFWKWQSEYTEPLY